MRLQFRGGVSPTKGARRRPARMEAALRCYAPTIWSGKRQPRMSGREQYREAAFLRGLYRDHRNRLRRYADYRLRAFAGCSTRL